MSWKTHCCGLVVDLEVVLENVRTSPLKLGLVGNQSLGQLGPVVRDRRLLRDDDDLSLEPVLPCQQTPKLMMDELTIRKLSMV